MVDHVLIPTDGSPQARAALQYAMEVHGNARITVLHVIDYVEESYSSEVLLGSETLHARAEQRADDLLADAREQAADHPGGVETDTVYGKPARSIVDYAADHDVDVVVMGSHGRSGVSRVLLGSVAQTVVQRASVPVTVVR
ncbi:MULTISPECIES: universal stress protein [Salinibaculum]|uniref:universal stress protein n=1 Tax=Salinibaculum TaxID=2732368 RepID=UPI0030D4E27E